MSHVLSSNAVGTTSNLVTDDADGRILMSSRRRIPIQGKVALAHIFEQLIPSDHRRKTCVQGAAYAPGSSTVTYLTC